MEIKVIPLYSGSSGNAVFVKMNEIRLLVDAGVSAKALTEGLTQVGESPENLDAILITHDHSDHIRGLDVFIRKYGIPTYATSAVWQGIRRAEKKAHVPELDHVIQGDQLFQIDDLRIFPFSTPHDARGSVGYRFFYADYSVAVATDLGHYSDNVAKALAGSDIVYIEANYDKDMLWNGPYPWHLKKRVDGERGHLCNLDCAAAIYHLYQQGTRQFILGHLSQENNSPRVAEQTVKSAMAAMGLEMGKDFHLAVANRFYPTSAVSIDRVKETQSLIPLWERFTEMTLEMLLESTPAIVHAPSLGGCLEED